MISLKILRYTSIREVVTQQHSIKLSFSPFHLYIQRRWLKPVDSAQTRLENRTRDHRLDKLIVHHRKLKIILEIEKFMSCKKRGPFVSVQLMSRWKNVVGLNIGVGAFIRKYPHVFELFSHPARRNLCCRMTDKMRALLDEEGNIIRACEANAVMRIKKLLLMSKNRVLHVHALRLIRRELGLPEDFRDSILAKYISDFKLVDLETVELTDADESLAVANVEQWREKEYREKWLSEFETKFAFPIDFPTGFKIERGFREKLKNWQRLPYVKPYEKHDVRKGHTRGGVERFEKRAVAVIHELLSLTVEKMVEVERLAHFRKDLGMEVNIRELLLNHPGIFYISTKGGIQSVFLREAYSKGCLIESNPIYNVRRKLLDLVLLEQRYTRELQTQDETLDEESDDCEEEWMKGTRDGDWVLPILEHEADSFPE
ncbi:PREDICTED: protein ROOT PRIMORDIUM DEFECTIVE 1 [Tarenaya hassleriana]|uniref:protein ROOT PRIMORDIUM DEFECTIVE 1 n=1 Tax=Tarenaya hassleriana TaxID=28532 RepID=UPI00053C394D|nr:PREDICTED: protein ROOT PRIMORDIUM DEFECTIVE 1 [Tarenaya hassleriana]XP_010541652.1 PREDICTED: protein ROOT PRIMORDIUM DEFECTIVE 1 [Tarenaya hassleriana]XP_010541729.1 PREDICTED: protein ROOT PRIMORDIUM DEFECTIVE 1 [Tarenaya hassleriana]XP_010541769.1 PREDICTED: protein ROOT PRIMORDIUM DEFECTIVE 1 [Tarenaya hassleriana]XP_010541811.1 PREDICTED: protein ROOT PRIMORDIUM DEFECTIVE 1 [Tarenaya hassleriana]